MHLGHQKVIETGRKIAEEKGLKLALMTFNQHPSIVFQRLILKNAIPDQFAAKEAHMEQLGVDILYIIEFTSAFANLAPQVFVDEYMIGLHAKVVVAGFDYTYGKKEIANMALCQPMQKDVLKS